LPDHERHLARPVNIYRSSRLVGINSFIESNQDRIVAMRTIIVFTGLGIIIFGLFLWIGLGYPIEIIGAIGLLNILLGIITPRSPGLVFQPEPSGPVKLIVDNASSRSGTYQLVFSDTKLIMKKLASRGRIMAVALVFAIIGGLVGGLTGYSVGELVSQRRRDRIQRENSLMTVTRGDMEIPYENMSQVELTKTKLKIASSNGPMTVFMPKKYPPMIATKLRELIPSHCWSGPVTASA